MRNTEKSWIVGSLAVFVLLFAATGGLARAPATGGNALLSVNAENDRPGPVEVLVEGWDVHGNPTISATLTWAADDESFSTETLEIPKTTRVLRLTFVNDVFTPPPRGPGDRNANIDFFLVNNLLYEAEDFDRTGGPDPLFPGCTPFPVSGVTVAECGNQGDFVEYDLHPGNPVGPGQGPGKRKGP